MKTPDEFAEDFFDDDGSYATRSLADAVKSYTAEALREAADSVPVDFWCTYGMASRQIVEGFQEWLRERADKFERGEV